MCSPKGGRSGIHWGDGRDADGPAVGVAAKGGHNGESHNHNDLGTFVLEAEGEEPLADLGAGEYTAGSEHRQDHGPGGPPHGQAPPHALETTIIQRPCVPCAWPGGRRRPDVAGLLGPDGGRAGESGKWLGVTDLVPAVTGQIERRRVTGFLSESVDWRARTTSPFNPATGAGVCWPTRLVRSRPGPRRVRGIRRKVGRWFTWNGVGVLQGG